MFSSFCSLDFDSQEGGANHHREEYIPSMRTKDDMPPPRRLYPGTEEYEEALRTGQIHLSILFSGLHHALQPESCHKDKKGCVVSPDQGSVLEDGDPNIDESKLSSSPRRDRCKDDIQLPYAGETLDLISSETVHDSQGKTDKASSRTKSPKKKRMGDSYSRTCGSDSKEEGTGDDENEEILSPYKRPRNVCSTVNPEEAPPSFPATSSETPPPSFEQTRFSDIIGHGAVKLRVDEILLPLGLPPEIAQSTLSGIRSQPTSILLYGPPGCGKTQLARAIAGEAQAAFFSVAPSDILSKFVGESEGAVRNLFRKAKVAASQLESKCAVVFLDEIDALGHTRENGGSGEGEGCSRRVLAELLLQFNNMLKRENQTSKEERGETVMSIGDVCASDNAVPPHVVVVAATNRPEDCDPALLRRFGIRLSVGPPSCRDRKKMFLKHLSGVHHVLSKGELYDLALSTEGWSGSDIESLAREAAMAPIRECLRSAAIQRRRSLKGKQARGQDSFSSEDHETLHTNMKTTQNGIQQSLLENLQKLRPVRIEDFENAISVLSQGELKSRTGGSRFGPKRCDNHYDSSSDEEYLQLL